MSGVKVFAPATVSNVCCGFDILGYAIHGPGDEVVATLTDEPGIHITKITGDKGKLPRETMKNTAGLAGTRLLEHLGKTNVGINMEIRKKMPFGSGMGSSAASAVAGVVAVNHLLGNPLTKWELLPFASAGEQLASGGSIHLDNVAPSLLGGMTLNRDNDTFDIHRVYLMDGLYTTLVYPHVEVLTADARNMLSPQTTLKQMTAQAANLGGLIIGLSKGDLDLIRRSLKDVIIEPQRAGLIPGFYDVQSAAMNCGVLGCSISGSGPSIFALSNNSLIAEKAGEAMQAVFTRQGIESNVYVSLINRDGAVVC